MREDAGFSQEKFAQKIQIDRSYYGRIERGAQNISITTICAIASGLGVSPAVLLADLTISDCSEATPHST
ncbi:helix-turn-helix domain-containing protein [Porphyrobacter algicida]|uniref:Helix-turn-helix domain-containing protein n=2 Tax=Qipengyuania algicida TaxID=1836209 RepID=A0A845AJF7_9SPHN|nr:helix-turn-helix domain-containing protein [Qipengyuania algicida]